MDEASQGKDGRVEGSEDGEAMTQDNAPSEKIEEEIDYTLDVYRTECDKDVTTYRIGKLEAENAALRKQIEALSARVKQRDRQIDAFNTGGFADADAMAEKYLDLVEKLDRSISYGEIDELCCELGSPEYVKTDDGEQWYWRFSGAELPVADHLGELLLTALLAARKEQGK
jgi:hypothetical protein